MVPLELLPTGIPRLETVLGGGIPRGNTVLVVGSPGSGKTLFSLQVGCHAAAQGQNVIYVSTLTEPAPRLLSHLRTLKFWDDRLLGTRIFIEMMSPRAGQSDVELADAIIGVVKQRGATMLLLDGITSFRDFHPGAIPTRTLLHELGISLMPLGCTTIVTSIEARLGRSESPEFSMCDGVIELAQDAESSRGLRTLRTWKMRGLPHLLGRHSLHITAEGLSVWPRVESIKPPARVQTANERLSTGSSELDRLMSGGVPASSTTIVAGAPGTGKTLLGMQFLAEGIRRGEPALFLGFREEKAQLLDNADRVGLKLEPSSRQELLTFIRHLPAELDPDQLIWKLLERLEKTGARRLVIDGVGELERAFGDPRRRVESLAFLTDALRGLGVSTLLTVETSHSVGRELEFSGAPIEVMAENVLLLLYTELRTSLRRSLSVLKMRNSAYDSSLREVVIGLRGVEVKPDAGAHS